MKLAIEKIEDLITSVRDWDRAEELMQAHWKEIAPFKNIMKLKIDSSKYLEAERRGALHIVTMRDDEKQIVGYSVHFLIKHPHYRHMTTAEDDVHYLVPELRGTGAHEQMRTFALRTLKEREVQFVTARVKVGAEHDRVLRQLGYQPIDVVYGLDLTKWPPPSEE